MKSLKDIKKLLKEHQAELREKYNVKELGVFGSCAKGSMSPTSDIDIVVDFYELPDLFSFLEMEGYLEKILQEKIDLIERTAIRPQLKDMILKEVVYV